MSTSELWEIAQRVFKAGVCPPDVRTVEAAFAVMLAGAELGAKPMQALRSVSIVKGKLSLTADFTVALCVRSPVCEWMRCVETTPERATYETQRRGHPAPSRLTWTIAQAQAAGLASSQTWRAHPAAMLRARCASALARSVYPDLVAGVYDPDEAAEIDRDGKPENIEQPHAELDGAALEPEPAPEQDPEALQAFFARVAEIELPGEGVAVWMKHREALGALDPRHRETAWKVLCKRIEEVGKMANAKVWLKKAIAEEDARRTPPPDGPRGGGAPAPQASANTNATGAAPESAPFAGARALAAVPTWAADEEGIRWHLSTKGAVRALENSVRLHGRALAGTSYLHLAAERLCALSPADERGTRLSAESARRRVDGWAEAGPVSASQPTAKAV